MSQSYNEVEALVKRAARGVNQAWGMADESAKATRWLAERGMAGPQAMAQLLDLYDTNTPVRPKVDKDQWSAVNNALLCPVISGTALSDFSMLLVQHKCIKFSVVACPLILLPFAAQASQSTGHCLAVRWNSQHYLVQGNRLAAQADSKQADYSSQNHHPDCAQVTVEVSAAGFDDQLLAQPLLSERGRVDRATINDYCWARLTTLAHRTYAPASEESRRLGAGAGNSDND